MPRGCACARDCNHARSLSGVRLCAVAVIACHPCLQQDILSKASDWHSIQDLVALSRQKDAKSLQDRLEATTKQLEEFSSQQTAAGFNATRAAELMDNLDKAAANAAQSVEVQRKRAKAAIKAARQDALGQVRQLEKRARAAVRSWRSDGRHAVNAQRQANMPEQLYESHDDQMRDAVGDTEQEVENAAEGLKDSINEHYGKLDDELEDVSIGASSKALRHRAEKAQHRLQELARNLGVQAALLEALAKARFAAEEKSWKDLHAPQLLAAVPRSANMSSEVATAQAQEQHAADSFQNSLNSLKDMSTPEVIRKVNGWQTLQELVAGSKPKETDSWEKTLESQTKKLERFNNESRKSALDFDASHAAELADAVEKASWHVEHDAEEQKHRMKATLKDAQRKAHQHVKALEAEAKAAAKSWKYHGRRAVRAQRAAHMPEHVYERHEDHMEDAVGDAEDKAEDAAERLEEQLSHHYEKLEDELADASFDASGKALRQRAEKAQHRLQELARNLGAHAALKEALAKARFAAEEKSWKESRAPQLLAAVPHSANMSSEVATAQAQEQHAADSFQNSLNSLKDMSTPEVIRKVNGWQTLQELVAGSKPKETDSWEKTLESQTKKLERFNNESRKSALDFDASHAAELADAVEKASWHVEHDAEEQKHRMKATLKDARRKAHQHVKALKAEAKAAAKSWKYHGRRAVRAQRAAHMPEHVYERHEDHMEDAVGDAEDKAEDAAERLEEQLSHHYEKLEDELADASFDASGKALRQRAEKAQHRLQELARNLGAQAALKEALAKARFAAEEKSWKESHAPQLLAAVPHSANMSSEVATAQAQEQHAADSFQNSLNSLKDMSTPEVIRKVNGWQTLQELVAGSKPKETDSWEKTLESQTKKLERFNNESRKSALDFDASHAAELADAVEKASWHVEHDAEEQKHRMKATLKDARRKAHQHVKALETEAKAAAKSWKYHGRRAVRAQRAAHMPEHVYERHEDHMEDAVGDAEDKAEDAAERLEEQLSHHYEKLEDELADASFDASGKALRQRAEKAQHRLQELARNLGAQAALKEALAKARFAAEEKSWKESHAPQLLLGRDGYSVVISCLADLCFDVPSMRLDAAASGDHLRGARLQSDFRSAVATPSITQSLSCGQEVSTAVVGIKGPHVPVLLVHGLLWGANSHKQ